MLRRNDLKTISKLWAVLGLLGALMLLGVAQAKPPSGAIFTTTPDGGIVNENVHYELKREVYLDGGPPPNAPQTAAGLDTGYYVFQVTDPSGKYLLSEDPARCRVVWVDEGVIQELVPPTLVPGLGAASDNWADNGPYKDEPCHIQDPPHPYDPAGPDDAGPSERHDTNTDVDHGPPAIVVQLMPYGTTPNPGGVYKAWIIPLASYTPSGDLDEVPKAISGKRAQPCPDFCAAADPGFGPPRSDSKTDNFKVKEYYPPEVTVRKFHDLDCNGAWDDSEPEIGVDQCVDSEGNIVPCDDGGWPYDWTYPLDGGTNTEPFWTPYTHVAGIPGTYSALEHIFDGWGQCAAFLDDVDLNITNPVDVYVMGDSRETHEIIFGDCLLAEVHGYKFIDLNGNGQKDASEGCDASDQVNYPGCNDVTVRLDGTDNLGREWHLTTQTGSDGYYEFTGVYPGTYLITVVEEDGFFCSYPDPCYHDVTLVCTDELGPFNFGDFSYAEVRGRKVIDLNADGQIAGDICDPSDTVNYPGCAGVTVHLDGKDGMDRPVHLTTQTCGGVTPPDYCEGKDPGYYEFTDLWPGNYMITVAEPDGFFCSYPHPCRYPVSLQSDEVVSCRSFGDFSKAEVHGRKVIDLNADGDVTGDTCPVDPDPWGNNAGCQGVIIHLDGTDNMGREVHLTTPTGPHGQYSFMDLWPGNYTITVAEPDGFFCSYPDPCYYPAILLSDDVVVCRRFGDFSKAEINVHKFFDADGSGTWDPSEADIEGIEFCLYQNGVQLDCEYTDENGMVSWTDLMPGTYTVVETLPPGWLSTNGTSWTGTLISDEIANLEFGNVITNCVGLTPGYWSNWDNHYTETQFLTLLEGTIAEGDIALADFYLTSFGCDNGDALHCMRRFLLANQLTLNLTQHPELPNPSDGSLFYVCQVPGVEGNLGDWLDEGLAILADPDSYDRDWILWVKTVLDWFANLWIVVGSLP